MKSIKLAIPSFFTCLALLAGCISVTHSTLGNVTMAAYFILIAAVLDFIDGFTARILNAVTAFGKQLDSLADVISFGFAPSMVVYRLIYRALVQFEPTSQFDIVAPGFVYNVILYVSFLIAIFAAIRLAKFNLDDSQVKNFRGLPTPASAILISAIGIVGEDYREFPIQDLIYNHWFLLLLVFVLAYLMVSNIPMFSLKFESNRLKGNLTKYLFLIISAVLLVLYGIPGLAPIILIYIIMSVIISLIPSEKNS